MVVCAAAEVQLKYEIFMHYHRALARVYEEIFFIPVYPSDADARVV